jgi:hypothetical protein
MIGMLLFRLFPPVSRHHFAWKTPKEVHCIFLQMIRWVDLIVEQRMNFALPPPPIFTLFVFRLSALRAKEGVKAVRKKVKRGEKEKEKNSYHFKDRERRKG